MPRAPTRAMRSASGKARSKGYASATTIATASSRTTARRWSTSASMAIRLSEQSTEERLMSNIEIQRDHNGAMHLAVDGHIASGAVVAGIQSVNGELTAIVWVPLKHAV